MSAIVASQRGRVGTILIAVGAMLVALAAVMVVGPAPIAQAAHDANCVHIPTDGTALETDDMGAHAVGSSGVTVTLSSLATGSGGPGGAFDNDVTQFSWSASGGSVSGSFTQNAGAQTLVTGTSGTSGSGTGNQSITVLIICGVGAGGTTVVDGSTTTVGDTSTTTSAQRITICHWNNGAGTAPGTYIRIEISVSAIGAHLPDHASHTSNEFEDLIPGINATQEEVDEECPESVGTTTTTVAPTTTTTVAPTTTTTVAPTTTTVLGPSTTTTAGGTTTTVGDGTTTTTAGDSTTTTVLGPDDPTSTTAGGTTTSVLGPDDPELPNNGAGHLLAILLGGLGFVFMGSGSLVVATERRRQFR